MAGPLKTRPNEDGTKTITYGPWTKVELHTLVAFPNVKEDSMEFAKQFDLTETHQPNFSDLCQLMHVLLGKIMAKEWMEAVDWKELTMIFLE